jgi:hypothetical protein
MGSDGFADAIEERAALIQMLSPRFRARAERMLLAVQR